MYDIMQIMLLRYSVACVVMMYCALLLCGSYDLSRDLIDQLQRR